jgi:hypothetical protein
MNGDRPRVSHSQIFCELFMALSIWFIDDLVYRPLLMQITSEIKGLGIIIINMFRLCHHYFKVLARIDSLPRLRFFRSIFLDMVKLYNIYRIYFNNTRYLYKNRYIVM